MSRKWKNLYKFDDKALCMNNYNAYMLMRTKEMFKYENLPNTIPHRKLEHMLQTYGCVCIAKIEEDDINKEMQKKQSNLKAGVYAFRPALSEVQDMYYEHTHSIVSNPCLNKSLDFEIDKDCVIMNNDSMRIGLLPLNKRYASLLVENDITMRIFDINTRMSTILSASDTRTQAAAETYIRDIERGKLGVIAETALLDGIKSHDTMNGSSGMVLSNLIEYEQYLKASWLNELGLQSNYNMKRESINSNEAQLNEDALLPLVDNMLHEREEAVKKINEMFDLNIKVSLASSWEDNQEELDLTHEMLGEDKLQEGEDKLQEGEDKPQEGEDDSITDLLDEAIEEIKELINKDDSEVNEDNEE